MIFSLITVFFGGGTFPYILCSGENLTYLTVFITIELYELAIADLL